MNNVDLFIFKIIISPILTKTTEVQLQIFSVFLWQCVHRINERITTEIDPVIFDIFWNSR